jgi:hypothetical protein
MLTKLFEPSQELEGRSYKPGDKPYMRKGLESVYDKWNISVVMCDTDIP